MPSSREIIAPPSQPCVPYDGYPSCRMSVSNVSAARRMVQPRPFSGRLYPKPGIDGTTTENASVASPPYATGSLSGPIMSR
jgi:hypothetical protein